MIYRVVKSGLPLVRAIEHVNRVHGAQPLVLVVPEATVNSEIKAGRFALRVMDNVLRIDDREIALRKSESDLLYVLLSRAGSVVAFEQLKACLKPPPKTKRGSLAVHIHALRAKIEPDPRRPRHLRTIRFRGYCFQP